MAAHAHNLIFTNHDNLRLCEMLGNFSFTAVITNKCIETIPTIHCVITLPH